MYFCSTARVRLVDGDDKCSGRVEVLHHSEWSTVCDHGWDLREAYVVCLELGCGLAESALRGSAFGPGRGEIWLRHVQCSGHESSLTRCGVVLYSISHCTHENDAGVKCSGEQRAVNEFYSFLFKCRLVRMLSQNPVASDGPVLTSRYPSNAHPDPAVTSHCVLSWGGCSLQLQRFAGSAPQRLSPVQRRSVHAAGDAEGRPEPDQRGANSVRHRDFPSRQL